MLMRESRREERVDVSRALELEPDVLVLNETSNADNWEPIAAAAVTWTRRG